MCLGKCLDSVEVEYVGFLLSEKGVRPQTKITEAILTYQEVKRFVGLDGFYREFIENFAGIATPLNNLTRDNVVFMRGSFQTVQTGPDVSTRVSIVAL